MAQEVTGRSHHAYLSHVFSAQAYSKERKEAPFSLYACFGPSSVPCFFSFGILKPIVAAKFRASPNLAAFPLEDLEE